MRFLISILIILSFASCKEKKIKSSASGPIKEILLTGNLKAVTQDSLFLFQHEGLTLSVINVISLERLGGDSAKFALKIPAVQKGMYFIGPEFRKTRQIILGGESKVLITGRANTGRNLKVVGSKDNDDFDFVIRKGEDFKKRFATQITGLKKLKRYPDKMTAALAEMKKLDQEKIALYDSLKTTDPDFLAKIAALYTYQSYQNNKDLHKNEVEYFVNEFFTRVDLASNSYNTIPLLFDKFLSYAQTMDQIGIDPIEQQVFADSLLKKIPMASKAYKYALCGLTWGYKGKNNTNFLRYGNEYVNLFGKDNAGVTASIRQEMAKSNYLAYGTLAPNIGALTPEGDSLYLSDLRGKVVLVDFWASWCGPCRRENPKVVAAYKKYKDKGFEVLGVSLDKTAKRWTQAIEKDGLTWPHISDLKGWSSQPAAAYRVRSIPATFLIDKKGNIIGKNLRGPALEKKLQQVLGD